MLIGSIQGANVMLTGEGCGNLPAVKLAGRIVSAWYPTPDELRLLNAGQPIYLHVFGQRQPPVALTVPNEENDNG